ncbi:uncharacterized protein LOC118124605 isoform X3 [Hippoglossus stenolepis]|uniref:uncharacterized protein LOC118124605 isoform X3 n=1 Tax=Hippoglossus stenolepis TaxID=195615 RepID=UPI001FAEE7D1|nr:uncharacterized protein LOC118124605 isoform X3 [Hippoglossus stenolepis]
MKWQCVFLVLISLGGRCFRCVAGDVVASDEHPDIGHDEDVHPHTLRETNGDVLNVNFQTSRDVPDTSIETNWDILDINQDDYEDADWRPPTSLQDTRPVLSPEDTPVILSGTPAVNNTNQVIATSSPQCGEYSSQLMSNGECRLMATLPPVGTSQKRCPDMFRCTDDVSYWLHENQDRKDQLEELRGTMSELQVELRNHRLKVKALEEEQSLNSTFEQRLRSQELRHAKFDTLLHVHATLLDELQAQLRNLSAAVQRVGRNTGCTVKVVRTTPPRGLRDTLPPGTHATNTAVDSSCLSVLQTVRLCITTVFVVLVFTPLSCRPAPTCPSTATWRRKVEAGQCFSEGVTAQSVLTAAGPSTAKALVILEENTGWETSSSIFYPIRVSTASASTCRTGATPRDTPSTTASGPRTRRTSTASTCPASVGRQRIRSGGTTTTRVSARRTRATSAPRSVTRAGGSANVSTPTSTASTTRGGATL